MWILEKIGKCPVEFVALPSIIHTDEPVKEELPEFERRLAEAVGEKLRQYGTARFIESGSFILDWDQQKDLRGL